MNLHLYQYTLPFHTPLKTSNQTFGNREGIILHYKYEDISFYSEAAPLPGFSTESLSQVIKTAKGYVDNLNEILSNEHPTKNLRSFYETHHIPASLQFGFDALGYQIEAHQQGQTLQQFLFSGKYKTINVNGLSTLSTESYLDDLAQLIESGVSTVKFKVGVDFKTELARLQSIRTRYPNINIRVDANQAWTLPEAITNCTKLSSLSLEYCEEPLKDNSPANFESLANQTVLPLAIDESLYQASYWPNLMPFTSFTILKPMVLGSFTRIFETNRIAATHDNETVFTTSLESGIGRHLTAILASGLGSTHIAHGLATAELLEKDVCYDLAYITNGTYQFNSEDIDPIINSHLLQIVV